MSLNTRIKERREQLNLSRNDLAEMIGVTPSAIANYENSVSSPKIELMYKLFDALQCDANYLHQDEMNALTYQDIATPQEMDTLVKKYRDLDSHGKEMVDFTLLKEWERSQEIAKGNDSTSDKIVGYTAPTVKAARNDYIDEDGELEKTQNDIANLKRPK